MANIENENNKPEEFKKLDLDQEKFINEDGEVESEDEEVEKGNKRHLLFLILLLLSVIAFFIAIQIRDYKEKNSPKEKTREFRLSGTLAFSNKEYEKAVDFFTKAINEAPNDIHKSELYAERAESYEKLKNIDQAINDYEKAVSIDPNTQIYKKKLAALYAAKWKMISDKYPDIAEEYHKKALELDPNSEYNLYDTEFFKRSSEPLNMEKLKEEQFAANMETIKAKSLLLYSMLLLGICNEASKYWTEIEEDIKNYLKENKNNLKSLPEEYYFYSAYYFLKCNNDKKTYSKYIEKGIKFYPNYDKNKYKEILKDFENK